MRQNRLRTQHCHYYRGGFIPGKGMLQVKQKKKKKKKISILFLHLLFILSLKNLVAELGATFSVLTKPPKLELWCRPAFKIYHIWSLEKENLGLC